VFLDFNPSEVFWAVDELMPREDCTTIHSTFLDNPFLPEEQIEEIKRLKNTDPDYWAVYGLGEFGSGRKLVYHYNVVDDIPPPAKLVAVGLDWGFTNDASALIEVWSWLDEIYINELVYKTNLTNQDIIRHLEMLGIDKYTEIIADSSEPKSIEELYRSGYNVKKAIKGPDSVMKGIDILKRYKLHATKNSSNVIKEFQNYKWVTDKNGNTLNQPVDAFNHSMDAIRYVAINKLGVKPKSTFYVKGL
jgi:phage terminase large subunit